MKISKSNAIIFLNIILSAYLIDLESCNITKYAFRGIEKYDIESNNVKENNVDESEGSYSKNQTNRINDNSAYFKRNISNRGNKDTKDDDVEKEEERINSSSNENEIDIIIKKRDFIENSNLSKKQSKFKYDQKKTDKIKSSKISLYKIENDSNRRQGNENSQIMDKESENENEKIETTDEKEKVITTKNPDKNIKSSNILTENAVKNQYVKSKSKIKKNTKNQIFPDKIQNKNDNNEIKEKTEETSDDSDSELDKVSKLQNTSNEIVKKGMFTNALKSKRLTNEKISKKKISPIKLNINHEKESKDENENSSEDSESKTDKKITNGYKNINSQNSQKSKVNNINKRSSNSLKNKISTVNKKNNEERKEFDEENEENSKESTVKERKFIKLESTNNKINKIHKAQMNTKSKNKNNEDESANETSDNDNEKDQNELHKTSKKYKKRILSFNENSKLDKIVYNSKKKKSHSKKRKIEDEIYEKDPIEDINENESSENKQNSNKSKLNIKKFKIIKNQKNQNSSKNIQLKQKLNNKQIKQIKKSNTDLSQTHNAHSTDENSEMQEGQPISNSKNEYEYIKKLKKLLLVKKACNKVDKSHLKIKIVRNPQFQHNPYSVEENTKYAKCQEKTGVLALVKNNSEDDNSDEDDDDLENYNSFNTIIATPIYISLTRENISLYTNFMSNSLFHTLHLSEITRIIQPKKFNNTFCFEIVSLKKLTAYAQSSTKILQTPLTLCSSSSSQMNEWVTAIQEFKQCHLNINQTSGDKILYDFEKINELLKSPSVSDSEKKLMNQLYYNNENSSFKNFYKQESERYISKELRSITDIIKSSNLQETKVKRELMNKLKSAEQFENEVKKKQLLIQDMIQRQIRETNEKDTKLITIQHKAKEYELLRAVKQRIKQIKMQELKEYKTAILTKIKQTQMKADTEASFMMKMLMDHNKLTDFSNSCNNQRLFDFKNKGYIDGICLKYFGESGHPICIQKKQFCPMCCSHHVGSQHVEKLFECKSKCTKLINGIKIDLIGEEKLTKIKNKNTFEIKNTSYESNNEHEIHGISEDPEEISRAIKFIQGEDKNNNLDYTE